MYVDNSLIEWLHQRIVDIHNIDLPVENVDGQEDDDDEQAAPSQTPVFYHPMRLSPKMLGKYPDMPMQPTCLSASILAASFFEKASTPYMHAGVQMSAYQ